MHKALFFLRHYNDIDHIVPVIYKWSRQGHVATVILLGLQDISQDYRIRFLVSLDGVRVFSLSDLLSAPDRFRFRFISLMLYGHAGRYLNDTFYRLFESLWPPARRKRLWRRLSTLVLNKAFSEGERGSVAFDWISDKSTLPTEFVREVVADAHTAGHTTICLPHGDSPHINELIRNHELRIEPREKYAESDIFDYVVTPNELCAKRYRPYLAESKIKVLGSARYSDEWLDVLQGLLPAVDLLAQPGTLRVSMFLRKKEFSLFWDEIGRVIRMLGNMERVHLIIKPHTRDYRQQPLRSILKGITSPRVEIADDDIHSAQLLAWSDVVIDISTSVAYEAVKRRIPVLAADYLHAGYSAIAHYIPEAAIHHRDDIYNAIIRLRENPDTRFYDENHRALFIQSMLDVPDNQVLERYIRLLSGTTQAPASGETAEQQKDNECV